MFSRYLDKSFNDSPSSNYNLISKSKNPSYYIYYYPVIKNIEIVKVKGLFG